MSVLISRPSTTSIPAGSDAPSRRWPACSDGPCLSSLEDAAYGLAFASGMAAITTLAYLLNPGDRVLGPDDIYGGTYRLLVRVLQRYGIRPAFVDMTDLTRVEAALADRPRMVVVETPTNPSLKILDIARIAELAHAHDALVVVDNTFASPYL